MIEPDDNTLTQVFRVQVLTPTHVGGASENHWQPGLDFITRDAKTWILDFEKLYVKFSPELLSRSLERGGDSLQNLLRDENLSSYSSKFFPVTTDSSEIKRHVFNGLNGKPFLPGSSLKGSVSSIFLNHFYRKFHLRGGNDIVKNVLGNFDNSIMRFFQFTDVSFKESQLISTKIFNLHKNNGKVWEGGWKQSGRETNSQFRPSGFTTTYECLKVGDAATMTLSFKRRKIDRLNQFRALESAKSALPPTDAAAKWLDEFSFATFCQLINDHTLNFLRKEITFFEKYNFDANTGYVLKNLRKLLAEAQGLDSSKECILRLAAGSGFHSITGDWQYDDFVETGDHDRGKNAGKRKYKSRKLAFEKDSAGQWEFWPMGFVKLSMISQADIERAERERIDEEKAKAQAAEAARLQAEAEAKALRRAEEEARRPQSFTGRVKQNALMDAVVVGFDKKAKKNLVELFIEGQENKSIIMHYKSLIDVGKVVIVKVNGIDKKGMVIDAHFVGFK